VEQFIVSENVGPVSLANVRLCVSEAVSNAVVHASPQAGREAMVTVAAEWVEHALVVTVTDNGSGFVEANRSPGLGLGLPLIAMLADSMSVIRPGHTGTEISITFRSLRGRGSDRRTIA
jgi:serine/threonine-protein kinase RsbW/stage II sporulation protein AB (anti-sigma F factor)